jgi:hypothetical protein
LDSETKWLPVGHGVADFNQHQTWHRYWSNTFPHPHWTSSLSINPFKIYRSDIAKFAQLLKVWRLWPPWKVGQIKNLGSMLRTNYSFWNKIAASPPSWIRFQPTSNLA